MRSTKFVTLIKTNAKKMAQRGLPVTRSGKYVHRTSSKTDPLVSLTGSLIDENTYRRSMEGKTASELREALSADLTDTQLAMLEWLDSQLAKNQSEDMINYYVSQAVAYYTSGRVAALTSL